MNRMLFTIFGFVPSLVMHGEETKKPNFIIINIDDLGYSDLEPYNSDLNKTPSIKQFADEGLVFKSFYSASSVSSPSRAGLMTGCYPQRIGLGIASNGESVLFPADSLGINSDEITLAERLKSVGYNTACIGKWHLGDQPEFLPLNHGFDYYYGLPYSNDMWPEHPNRKFPPLPLIRDNCVIDTIDCNSKQEELCDRFTSEAVSYIEKHKDVPFFLYMAHSFVHGPHIPKKEYKDRTINSDKNKGGLVLNVDYSVGEIVETLKKNGIDNNTIVWIISDNGGIKDSNQPLKGRKGSFYEGGYRVASIVRWPGRIKPQADNYEIVSSLDIYPTFCYLAGIKKIDGNKIDGIDVHEFLLSENLESPRKSVCYYVHNSLEALRLGKWKLLSDGTLYDLENDICEKNDVSGNNPEVVDEMLGLMQNIRYELGDEKRGIIGNEIRPAGRKTKDLRFLIPGTDDNGLLREYWISLKNKKIKY